MKKKQNLSRGRKAARNFVLVLLVLWLAGVLAVAPLYLVEGKVRAKAAELGYGRDVEILSRTVLPCRVEGERAAWLGGTVLVLARAGDRLLSAKMERYDRPYITEVSVSPWPKETTVYHLFPHAYYDITLGDAADALVAVNLPRGAKHGLLSVVTGPLETDRWGLWGERNQQVQEVMFFWVVSGAAAHYGMETREDLWKWMEDAQYSELKLIDKNLKQIQSTQGAVVSNWENWRDADGTG